MECIWFLQFRLTQSGICNCMYLVESHGQRQYSLPISTLLQAAANTQFIDRFTVKFTNNSHDTVVYLSTFTKVLARKFSVSTISCLLFFVLTNSLLFHLRPSLWEQEYLKYLLYADDIVLVSSMAVIKKILKYVLKYFVILFLLIFF